MKAIAAIRVRGRFALMCTLTLACGLGAASAAAASTVSWRTFATAEPTRFSPDDADGCEKREAQCDRYELLVLNGGDTPSSGRVTVTDTLPRGITLVGGVGINSTQALEAACSPPGSAIVTCTFEAPVPAGAYFALTIPVSAPTALMAGPLRSEVSVTGGGAGAPATEAIETQIGGTPEFGLQTFSLQADAADGTPELQAGTHPWQLTSAFSVPTLHRPPANEGGPATIVENVKDVSVELPPGLVGNPQAAAQCTETELRQEPFGKLCPAASRVGVVAYTGAAIGGLSFTEATAGAKVSPVYNVVPDAGYPAELGFALETVPVFLYASVAHGSSGYHLRIADPGVPETLELFAVSLTFYGDPARFNGQAGAQAFLTDPSDCSSNALTSRIELESWERPGVRHEAEQTVYPQVSDCAALHFEPTIEFAPRQAPEGTSQTDTPSGYEFALKLPQTSLFGERATPEPRDVAVTLPAGVSLSPAAANGLVGCAESGSQGIDLPQGEHRATEAGEGEAIGADGLSHLTAGHCPSGSTIGTVEAFTPLLPSGPGGSAPLTGQLYLAEPHCGGAGQPACSEASAANGELYGVYLELEGHRERHGANAESDGEPESDGVIVKLKGSVSANPSTGQLTATFNEDPQLPFSELKLRIDGGERAPLANPQTCGSFTTTSDLVPWSSPETPDATPFSSFAVTGCANPMPFAPSFEAGTVAANAASSSPFTLTLARHDGEQELSAISTTLPPGLVGMVSQVPLCEAAQANAGTCPEASKIGTATVAAGAGSEPLWLTGNVYLTGSYNGAPFGLSVVVPAQAGPFNLGNVVVRAAISIDPNTSAVTVTSAPLPQIRDGVPFRVQKINVSVDRPGFILTPTNCEAQRITGQVAGAQGAVVDVSMPFAVAGCKNLAFKPSLGVSTRGKASKLGGASLDLKISFPAGQEANVRSVKVALPKQLPSRLSTLRKACVAAVFAENPATCPAQSVVGIAKASTPVLPGILTGPVYLVSHANESFPNVVVVLQGDGVRVDLTGLTDIEKGVTSSTFSSIPDVPVNSFELYLPEGPFSALAANLPEKAHYDFCGRKLAMPTLITGQNGAVIKQTTSVEIAGCQKAEAKKKAKAKKKQQKQKKRKMTKTRRMTRTVRIATAGRGDAR